MQAAEELAEGGRQPRGSGYLMFHQRKAGEFEAPEDARLDVDEERLWNRQRGQLGHRGQQVRLAPGRFAAAGGVGLLARPDDQLAVDLVGDVVRSLTQLGQGTDVVARLLAPRAQGAPQRRLQQL